jgi:hypothetical protein
VTPPASASKPTIRKLSDLSLTWTQPLLDSEAKVEGYVAELKKALLAALAAGEKVIV